MKIEYFHSFINIMGNLRSRIFIAGLFNPTSWFTMLNGGQDRDNL